MHSDTQPVELYPVGVCPICGGQLEFCEVPCPDGVPGCLVLHTRPACVWCGVVFALVPWGDLRSIERVDRVSL